MLQINRTETECYPGFKNFTANEIDLFVGHLFANDMKYAGNTAPNAEEFSSKFLL